MSMNVEFNIYPVKVSAYDIVSLAKKIVKMHVDSNLLYNVEFRTGNYLTFIKNLQHL